jgi:hypothetical protein
MTSDGGPPKQGAAAERVLREEAIRRAVGGFQLSADQSALRPEELIILNIIQRRAFDKYAGQLGRRPKICGGFRSSKALMSCTCNAGIQIDPGRPGRGVSVRGRQIFVFTGEKSRA